MPAAAAPANSVRDQQAWVLNMLDVQSAWQLTEGANVTVAVIDSGVNPDVSDLDGAVITGSDFTDLKTSNSDPHWGQHGTWMASIIAGRGDGYLGGDGIIGVAPEAKILSIRVIPDMNDPGYKKYDSEREGQIQDELADGDHGGGPSSRPGNQHVDRLLGAERRGQGRAAERLRPRHRAGGVGRQLGRQR